MTTCIVEGCGNFTRMDEEGVRKEKCGPCTRHEKLNEDLSAANGRIRQELNDLPKQYEEKISGKVLWASWSGIVIGVLFALVVFVALWGLGVVAIA